MRAVKERHGCLRVRSIPRTAEEEYCKYTRNYDVMKTLQRINSSPECESLAVGGYHGLFARSARIPSMVHPQRPTFEVLAFISAFTAAVRGRTGDTE